MKGSWEGDWNADRSAFNGTYTFPDGRKFVGVVEWVTQRVRHHIGPTGRVDQTVAMSIQPHWEFTGTWIRRDGKAASSPHMPEPPEERDNGEPPPESDDDDPPEPRRRRVPAPIAASE